MISPGASHIISLFCAVLLMTSVLTPVQAGSSTPAVLDADDGAQVVQIDELDSQSTTGHSNGSKRSSPDSRQSTASAPRGDLLGAAQTDGTDQSVVTPALTNATGTVTVVVRLETVDREVLAASTPATETLETHARRTQERVDSFANAHAGVTVENRFWLANAMVLEVDTDEVSLGTLAAQPGVRAVHENFRVQALGSTAQSDGLTPASAFASAESTTTDNVTYGLEQMGVPRAWNETRGAGAQVAVLDTGVDVMRHPDLAPIDGGWAEFGNSGTRLDTTPNDQDGHGTHVSGTVVGNQTANGTHYGVAPEADLLHGKVLDDDGAGTFASIVAGMEWATEHEAGVDVMSMSLGVPGRFAERFIEPIRNARAEDITVVISSGNSGPGTSASPGNAYDALAVGASDQGRDIAAFSSGQTINTTEDWGDAAPAEWPDEYTVPDVAASGVKVTSARAGGGFVNKSGTSMAAPHVAGATALLESVNEDVRPDGVEDALTSTATKPAGEPTGKDTRYGAGIVNVSAAIEEVEANATIGGYVETSGARAGGVTVSSSLGFTTETDPDGTFELDVPTGEQNLTVDAFGFASKTKTVTADDPDNITLVTFSLDEPVLEAETITAPEYVPSGDTVRITQRVAHANFTTVSLANSTRTIPSNASLRVNGFNASFGEPVFIGGGDTITDVTVTITTESDQLSAFVLEQRFRASFGSDRTVSTTTAPIKIHPETVVVPDDVDPMHPEDEPYTKLQDVLDFVVDGTTVELNHSTFVAEPSVTIGTGLRTSLALTEPVTLTAASNTTPVIEIRDVASPRSTAGIVTRASDVTISGIELRGGGAAAGVFTDGFEATVTNNTIRNTTSGLLTAGKRLTLEDNRFRKHTTGVTIPTGSVSSISGNSFTDVEVGVDARPQGQTPPTVVAVNNNTFDGSDSLETGLQLSDTSESVDTTIRGNEITNASAAGIRLTASSNQTIADNRILESGTGIELTGTTQTDLHNNTMTGAGIVVANASVTVGDNNSVHDARTGVLVTNASQNTTLVDTRFENVTSAVRVHDNSTATTVRNVEITNADGTIEFGAVDAGANTVANATLAGSSALTVSGTNATLALNQSPPDIPLQDLGTVLELHATGDDPALSTEVSYSDSAVEDVDESTLQLYTYADTWTPVTGSSVNTGTNVVSGTVTQDGSFAPLGETGTGGSTGDGDDDDSNDGNDGSDDGGSEDDDDGFTGGGRPLPPRDDDDDEDSPDDDADEDDEDTGTDEGDSPPQRNASVPTPVIDVTPETATVGEAVTFSAADSTVEGSIIGAYEWTIDGKQFGVKRVTTTFDEPGEIDVTLTVTAVNNVENTTTTTITIEPDEETGGGDDGKERDDSGSGGSPLPGFSAIAALLGILLGVSLKRRG